MDRSEMLKSLLTIIKLEFFKASINLSVRKETTRHRQRKKEIKKERNNENYALEQKLNVYLDFTLEKFEEGN